MTAQNNSQGLHVVPPAPEEFEGYPLNRAITYEEAEKDALEKLDKMIQLIKEKNFDLNEEVFSSVKNDLVKAMASTTVVHSTLMLSVGPSFQFQLCEMARDDLGKNWFSWMLTPHPPHAREKSEKPTEEKGE